MGHVKGIGGIFIDSNQAQLLSAWYTDVLGIDFEAHPDGSGFYHVFFTRDAESSVMRANPVFAIQQSKSELNPGARGFVINLRVDDLLQVLEQLRAKGIEMEGEILEWERGKHAWIRDLDGNRIELYEELFPA